MRIAAIVVMGLAGVAGADARRECHLQDEQFPVTDLGCFETLDWEFGQPIGTRVCLIRADTNVCSGVLAEFMGGDPPAPLVLDKVDCEGNGNAIRFRGSRKFCMMNGHCSTTVYSFTGVLEGDRLRGTYVNGSETTKVSWKRTRKPFATAAHIRRVTARACAKPGS